MKKITFTILIFLAAGSVNAFSAETFSLSSADIQSHRLTEQQVFAGFGCHGGNTSPQLGWHNPPAGTKSFAITVYDPSAPTGSGWWHWTVVNIPVQTQTLPTGAGDEKSPTLPDGAVQGRNDYGYAGFGGACPPVGDKPHPYQFTVWALSTDKLPIDSNASGALVGYMLNSNVIAKASFTATYGR